MNKFILSKHTDTKQKDSAARKQCSTLCSLVLCHLFTILEKVTSVLNDVEL